MNRFDISKIKSNLNIFNAQDGIDDVRKPIHIEVTITNACNMNCKYCFEHDHSNTSNHAEEERQLDLIRDLCINFDTTRFSGVEITFWGGEPLLNVDFMKKIIEATSSYAFVNYFMYSNGTLVDQYINFINDIHVKLVRSRFRIQLSYDGDPINRLERGIDKDNIIKVARLLKENGFAFSFKATVSSSTIKHMPSAWKSYEKLYDMFHINYAPTFDMTSNNIEAVIDDWKNAMLQIMAYEYSFFKKHNSFLLSWLNYKDVNDNKLTCSKDYACHLHTDGNIYICHGCPYLNEKTKFVLNKTNAIDTLLDVLKEHQYGKRGNACFDCPSVFCNFCHLYSVNPDDIFGTWLSSIDNNKNRCYFFKYVGTLKKLLDYILIDGFAD